MHSGIVVEKGLWLSQLTCRYYIEFLTSGSNFVCLKNAKEDSAPLV